MHDQFEAFLGQYQLSDKKYHAPMKEIMYYTFKTLHEARIEETAIQQKNLIDLNTKLDCLEERFVLEEISQIQYQKFKEKLDREKLKIEKDLHKDGFNLSNLEKAIDLALQYSLQLPSLWSSGDLEVKRRIQNMVFPDGILYDFKNAIIRTTSLNSIFSVIPSYSKTNKDKKKSGEISNFFGLDVK